ncbi:MAG: DUF1580 domain-containing protein [Pirellulales bacterium]
MIDPKIERLITLRQACKMLPKRRRGKSVHISCIYRWTLNGVRGVILESLQVGGTRCTSREALHRFFERLSEGTVPVQHFHTRTPSQRARDNERARQELIKAGC